MLTIHEAARRKTNTDAVAEFFQRRPSAWISAWDLERVGGRWAWRTRVSECRTLFGMTIENRQRTRGGAADLGIPLRAERAKIAVSLEKTALFLLS